MAAIQGMYHQWAGHPEPFKTCALCRYWERPHGILRTGPDGEYLIERHAEVPEPPCPRC